MKTIQTLIKDLTGITVEEQKINEYLEYEALDLQGAYLRSANLQGTDLWCANLEYANLRSANLENACLVGANLENACLLGARITKKQLEQLTVIKEDE
ncbi:pentapeptide repeat-containing protein [Spiroplasma phoeniceum]|uniref:Pentapeptide repeat-containing protein n=1 Tax=Spiroplasma phoeniceum P40 TaxID=1276259 RepID=A0A345DLW5_9MOLU|nr:pentapeptide repeat-containing protein [Spiroplasma phoeniceum]AXF95203.1 hypothetical protein SDAV_00208 [Spiroplasma phoeniceum P40]